MDSCGQGSIFFELLKGVPAAFVVFVIGCITARIAYNQFRVAQAKLKLDLFERRYKIFQQTWEIASVAALNGTRTAQYGLGTPLSNFTHEASFLFGADVVKYLDELTDKWIRLHALEGFDDPSKYAKEKSTLQAQFHDAAKTQLKQVFAPYLNFESWK